MNQNGYPQPGQVCTYKCGNCGAPLQNNINQEFITCRYCGSTNQIPQQAMNSTISFSGVQVNARTDIESLIRSADYLITCKQYDKAKETLLTAIMSGADDYRIYLLKVKIDMWTEEDLVAFEDLNRLKPYEASEQNRDGSVTRAICTLMHYKGTNGVTLLHRATYQVLYDEVVYCVEHQADVNILFGFKQLSPISIMFLPSNPRLETKRDEVKAIRDYLMAHGAVDIKRKGF